MRRFAAVWGDWPRSRAYAISIQASSPLFAAAIPTKRRWRNFCSTDSGGHYRSRLRGAIWRMYCNAPLRVRKPSLRSSASSCATFQRGNDGVRSALHVADEIGHSLPFRVQYDQGRKAFDFVFASQLHILFSDRVALRFGTRKIEFDQNQILCGVVLELRFGKNFRLHALAIAAPIRAGKIE